MKKRVVITGIGLVTPLGNNREETWKGLKEGRSGIARIKDFDPAPFSSQIAGEVKDFDPAPFLNKKDSRRLDHFVQYAVSAAVEAFEDANLRKEEIDKEKSGSLVGAGIGGLRVIEKEHRVLLEKGPGRVSPFLIPMLIPDMASGYLAIYFGLRGPNYCTVSACASGSHALGQSFRFIQNGEAELMISGGAESCITPLGLAGFCNLRSLSVRNDEPEKASRPFDKMRDGFIMSEGAGILILEELKRAKNRRAKIYAEIIGYGASADAYHITAPDPNGIGASLSMKSALKDAEISPEKVDYINAHGTSTQLNDKSETLAIKKVFGEKAYSIPISSIKSMTGHLLGAAGGVELAATALSIKEGIIPPTINYEFPDPECDLDYVPNEAREKEINIALSNSFGFGGHNATLVLKKYKE